MRRLSPSAGKQTAPVVAFVLIVAGLWGLRMQGPFPPYVDDAYIYLRFARHIAGGLGAVWNPGEPPVEGYTSPLYELLLSDCCAVEGCDTGTVV
jgi:hypothetical protein